MAHRGKYAGGTSPFGYSIDPADPSRLAINEREAETVRLLYRLYTEEGLSMRALARRLNVEGVPTRGLPTRSPDGRHKGWTVGGVSKVLTKPLYKGTFQHGRRRVKKSGKGLEAGDPAKVIEVDVPALVPEEVWEAARARAITANRLKPNPKARQFYLLQGVPWCRVCGHRFRSIGVPAGTHRVDAAGRPYVTHHEYRSYVCRGMANHPGLYHCRQPGSIAAERLERPVLERLYAALRNPEVLHRAAGVPVDELRQGRPAQARQRKGAALRQRLTSLRQERDGAVSLASRGIISDEDLAVRLADLDVRAAGLERELEALGQQEDEGERLLVWEERRQQLQTWLASLAQPLSVAEVGQSPELQRELLLRVVDRVWVDAEGNIEIEGVVNLPPPPKQRRVWVPKGRTIGQTSVGTGGGSRYAGKEGGNGVQGPSGPRGR